jgi:hypothetical protein
VYYCVCVCILRVMFVPVSSFFLSRCCSLYNEHHVFFFVARFFFSSFLFFFFFFYRNTFALACLREFSSSNSETIHLFDYTFFYKNVVERDKTENTICFDISILTMTCRSKGEEDMRAFLCKLAARD